MKSLLSFVILFVALFFGACNHVSSPDAKTVELSAKHIIPVPQDLTFGEGAFVMPAHLHVQVDELAKDAGQFFGDFCTSVLKCEAELVKQGGDIVFETKEMLAEAYELEIHDKGIRIYASDFPGFFYAVQTLIQMFPADVYQQKEFVSYKMPAITVKDAPRFAYRGMHLDVCRHFFPVDFLKKYLDVMARYKMNRFHWHLTEDQGWRIEIKAFPKLQEIASIRTEQDGSEYGGYYTQDEVKEIVTYAAARGITVIPEIELPGHARAALAAYPEYSCSGEQLPVANTWGVFDHVYCAGKDSTFAFLQTVLDEVLELFPSTYIHIGGDECPKGAWEKCADCQARIKAEGLEDEHELQSYFIRRIEAYLNEKGRKLIGWDEILEGGLAPDATVMSWRGEDGGIAAAKQGHYAIMTPGTHCYFDHYQARQEYEPKAICCYSPLKKVYHYEPVPAVLSEEEKKYILGAQANVWTEYMHTSDHVEYMLLPRMLALAEVVWSQPERKSWDDFNQRLQSHKAQLEVLGYNLSKGDFSVLFESAEHDGKYHVELSSEQYEAVIRYTLDGSDPLPSSPQYKEALQLDAGMEIRAGVFVADSLIRGDSRFVVE